MRRPSNLFAASIGLLAVAAILLALAAPSYTSTAKLFGVGPLRGNATCTSRGGTTGPYRVDVDVTNGQPAQTLDVQINDVNKGQIVTDSSGAGHLRINNIPTALGASDTITVANLSGVFFDRGAAGVQHYDLSGTVTNIVGVRYVVRYHEFFENNKLERRWEVTITNAEPAQSVPTFVRTVFVQPLLPNASGVAKLRLKTAAFIDSAKPGPWSPLANSFPTLVDGELVQVGTSFIPMHRE